MDAVATSKSASDGDPASLPETGIVAGGRQTWRELALELWAYRELLAALIVRDLKVRYKQTVLGIAWVVLQPLLTSGLLALVFASVRDRESAAGPTLLYFLAALVPWNGFAQGVQTAALSLENSAHLLSKVYFPRLLVPAAGILAAGVDFAIAWLVFWFLAAWSGAGAGPLALWVGPLWVLQTLAAAGLGFTLAVLNAQYRDLKYVIPFLLQSGMLVTVLLADADLPWGLRWLVRCNPLAAVAETNRALLRQTWPDAALLSQGIAVALLLGWLGVTFFRRREAMLADIL